MYLNNNKGGNDKMSKITIKLIKDIIINIGHKLNLKEENLKWIHKKE